MYNILNSHKITTIFFNSYARHRYKLLKNKCLCGKKNDILLSQTDRHCVDFTTVVCKSCGLIRAKKYFADEDVKDFYKNFYRKNTYHITTEQYREKTGQEFFNKQKNIRNFNTI